MFLLFVFCVYRDSLAHRDTFVYKKIWKILDEHKCVPYNMNHKEHKSVLELKRKGEMNMENTMKMYITADEVAELLGVSRGYAYKVIRGLNDELKAKGFRVISGKVPRKYFQEKFYGMVV